MGWSQAAVDSQRIPATALLGSTLSYTVHLFAESLPSL